jgi:hypothetical protein
MVFLNVGTRFSVVEAVCLRDGTVFLTVAVCFPVVGRLFAKVGMVFSTVDGWFSLRVAGFGTVEMKFPKVGARRATVEAVFAGAVFHRPASSARGPRASGGAENPVMFERKRCFHAPSPCPS